MNHLLLLAHRGACMLGNHALPLELSNGAISNVQVRVMSQSTLVRVVD